MIRDQDDSRAKAEAAYERADRAYTKAVETYGGFDDRTVAAYRRRQKAEQALHAILRRNPGDYEQRLAQAEQNRGQLFRSLRGKTKQELLGILSQQYRIHCLSAKDSITDLKYAITSAAFPDPRPPRRNPASKRSQLSSLNRRIAAAERAGMPVAYLMEQRDLLLLKRGKKRNPSSGAKQRARGSRGYYQQSLEGSGSPEQIRALIKAEQARLKKYEKGSLAYYDALGEIEGLKSEHRAAVYGRMSRAHAAGWGKKRNPGKASFFSVYYRSLLELGMSPVNAREAVKQAKKANLTESDKRAVAKGLEAALKHKFGIRNPGLAPAGKKHLIQTMHKAGADTFRKKVAYVRRHIPNVTDPQAFVGYVMAGERKGKRR